MAFATIVTNCDKAHSLHIAHLIIIGFTVLYIFITNGTTTATATNMHVIYERNYSVELLFLPS